MAPRRSRLAALALVPMAALALGACSSSGGGSGGGSDTSTAPGSAANTDTGSASTTTDAAAVYKPTYTAPPTGSNPAAKGKTVWVISVGQASPTGAASANAAMKAGKAIGWSMKLFDAKLDPAQFSDGIKQAIAAKANGVVLIAVDCPAAKSALQQAKAAGVKSVGIYALDCNEVDPSQPSLFSSQVSFGSRYKNLAQAYEAWGADSAKYAIAKADGKADSLSFENSEYLILKYYQQGYDAQMKTCSGCKNTVVPWLAADFGAKLTAITQAALLKDPTANVVQGGSNPTLGITQGVTQSGRESKITSVGGLGLSTDNDAIRQGQLTAANSWPTEWFGYAAIDTLNSVFNGTPVRDEGLGWQMADKTHNLPASGDFKGTVDYAADYAKSWGVS
jgi:ribose transport system substrate-binding protein